MRRNLIASTLSIIFVFAGFACGAANSDVYAVMPSEAESASAKNSAPPRVSASAVLQREPEAIEAAPIAEAEEDSDVEERRGAILGLIGGSSSAGFIGVLGADSSGLSSGFGGLGLSGIGTGGIGIGSLGTSSPHTTGRLGGSRNAPRITTGPEAVTGKLPPEVIKRIVRSNLGRMRLCYENGLRTNPKLEGRVSARFVIGRDGSVSNVINNGSTMPNTAVVTCVLNAFKTMSFPQPDGGIVVVSYPLMFKPADTPAAPPPPPPPPPPAPQRTP